MGYTLESSWANADGQRLNDDVQSEDQRGGIPKSVPQ